MLCISLVAPAAAFAQSTDTSAQIAALLAEIQLLEQQMTSFTQGSASPSQPLQLQTQPARTETVCPVISRTLSLGVSGGDVTSLQQFLAQEGYLGSSTGHFDVTTQSAVAAWQEKNGVVSGGSAATTGLGVVGPKTRAAIAGSCNVNPAYAGSQSSCLPTLPPVQECSTGWQPVADSSGCVEYYQCSIPLPGAASTSASATTTLAATSTAPTVSCPTVAKPQCSGSVIPFYTSQNGCVLSYECVL